MHAFAGCLDATTDSCVVVTTRIQSLVAGAAEVPLELLSADDAAKMLLTVAGVRAVPPYSPAVHAAACLQTVLDEEMGGWPNTFG